MNELTLRMIEDIHKAKLFDVYVRLAAHSLSVRKMLTENGVSQAEAEAIALKWDKEIRDIVLNAAGSLN